MTAAVGDTVRVRGLPALWYVVRARRDDDGQLMLDVAGIGGDRIEFPDRECEVVIESQRGLQ
jgi:hypothetical protein